MKDCNIEGEKFMHEMKKYWDRGVNFSCGKEIIENFSVAEALAEDGRYMAEMDTDAKGFVINVNFQDIGE